MKTFAFISFVIGAILTILTSLIPFLAQHREKVRDKNIEFASWSIDNGKKIREKLVSTHGIDNPSSNGLKQESFAQISSGITELQDLINTHHDCGAINELLKFYEEEKDSENITILLLEKKCSCPSSGENLQKRSVTFVPYTLDKWRKDFLPENSTAHVKSKQSRTINAISSSNSRTVANSSIHSSALEEYAANAQPSSSNSGDFSPALTVGAYVDKYETLVTRSKGTSYSPALGEYLDNEGYVVSPVKNYRYQ